MTQMQRRPSPVSTFLLTSIDGRAFFRFEAFDDGNMLVRARHRHLGMHLTLDVEEMHALRDWLDFQFERAFIGPKKPASAA